MLTTRYNRQILIGHSHPFKVKDSQICQGVCHFRMVWAIMAFKDAECPCVERFSFVKFVPLVVKDC